MIESVLNVSEGRDAGVTARLVAVLSRATGVALLDTHVDADHHRCVLTYAGDAESVADAAYALVAEAAACINLNHHAGQHPRIGAADVLPFIPLRGATMHDCVALARRVGARIGHALRIPVFLYEEACDRPFRTRLEQIRHGGLEALRTRMASDPAWAPDFGPPHPHPTAGVIVVGARPPLIAYNVCLRSDDVSMAKTIAGAIRASGGGLPGVKAVGLALQSRGVVQVSMNLTDYRHTSLPAAFAAVAREASRHGVDVTTSELVGLIPLEAFEQTVGQHVPCDTLTPDRVIEHRLDQCGLGVVA